MDGSAEHLGRAYPPSALNQSSRFSSPSQGVNQSLSGGPSHPRIDEAAQLHEGIRLNLLHHNPTLCPLL